jgi:hypothetical protein
MARLTFFILTLLVLTASCDTSQQTNHDSSKDRIKATVATSADSAKSKFETTEINCDTIYPNKNYKIKITQFDTTIWDYDTIPNSVFVFYKEFNGQKLKLFSDSIHIMSQHQNVKFSDFNGDNIKDILIQNISDVRSNPTYYLYLVDTIHDKLTKIRGFEEIKNPNYVSKYNLIDNYVLSGQTWTSFYKIQNDTIKDFGIVIYDDNLGNGNYERDYNKAIKKILTTEKNNR